MRSVPVWALVSSGCAPVVLIMGWLMAASLQGPAYDPAAQTISVLAAPGNSGSVRDHGPGIPADELPHVF
ncbi:hypothetical protein ABZZ16_30335, partial [Streptomyces sp. NPDC006386]